MYVYIYIPLLCLAGSSNLSVATDSDPRYDEGRPRLSTFGTGGSATLRRPSGHRPIAVAVPSVLPSTTLPHSTATLPHRRPLRHDRHHRQTSARPSEPITAAPVSREGSKDSDAAEEQHHAFDRSCGTSNDARSNQYPDHEGAEGIMVIQPNRGYSDNQGSLGCDGLYQGESNPYSRPSNNRTGAASRTTPAPCVFPSNYPSVPPVSSPPPYMAARTAPLATSDTTASTPQSSCEGPEDSIMSGGYSPPNSPQYMSTMVAPPMAASVAAEEIYKQQRLLNLPARARPSDYSTPSIIYSQRTGVKIAGLPASVPPPPPPPPPPSTNPPLPPFQPHPSSHLHHEYGREPSAPR